MTPRKLQETHETQTKTQKRLESDSTKNITIKRDSTETQKRLKRDSHVLQQVPRWVVAEELDQGDVGGGSRHVSCLPLHSSSPLLLSSPTPSLLLFSPRLLFSSPLLLSSSRLLLSSFHRLFSLVPFCPFAFLASPFSICSYYAFDWVRALGSFETIPKAACTTPVQRTWGPKQHLRRLCAGFGGCTIRRKVVRLTSFDVLGP